MAVPTVGIFQEVIETMERLERQKQCCTNAKNKWGSGEYFLMTGETIEARLQFMISNTVNQKQNFQNTSCPDRVNRAVQFN